MKQGLPCSFRKYSHGDAPISGWLAAKARADSAPADIRPGLRAESVPGGAAYAGVTGRSQIEAVVAANLAGRIPTVSLGHAADLPRRVAALLKRFRLVVAGL